MEINLINIAPQEPESDCLIIPVYEDNLNEIIESEVLLPEDKSVLALLLEKGQINGKAKSYFFLTTPMSSYENIAIIGLGKKEKYHHEIFRRAVGKFVPKLEKHNAQNILLDVSHHNELNFETFIEGLMLAQYTFTTYKKSQEKENKSIKKLSIFVNSQEDLTLSQLRCDMADLKCRNTNFARDLGNTPACDMTPTILAEKCKEIAKNNDCEFEVIEENQMQKLGLNLLYGVGRGSQEDSKLIIVKYKHPEATKTLAIVGKGVTFDSGGINMKSGPSLAQMKYDMCGSAAVIGAMKSISEIKPKINLIMVVPAVENLNSGHAQIPGDIVKGYNGTTVEINNTDAEGRLILADALAYTIDKFQPDMIVNIATLTGAVITSLGRCCAGIMTNNDVLADSLNKAGEKVNERLWPLPMWDDYKEMIKGKFADISNIGPAGEAGTIMGGCFLERFVDDTPWAHIDIAAVAWAVKGVSYYKPEFSTGFGVRLLTRWILNEAE